MSRVLIATVALAVGVVILGTAALTSFAVPQKGSGKGLPQYYKQLGLSKDQTDKVYKIQGDYRSKIKALTEQIKQLRDDEIRELRKVLTDDQRKMLREIYEKKAGGPDVSPNKEDTKKEEIKEKKAG